MILAPVFLYTRHTLFPGFTALVPCLGAAAIIYANATKQTLIGQFLSLPLFVFIGKISYSLYLFHWPFIAYYTYIAFERPSAATSLSIIVVTFAFACFSYYFVETPFRRKTLCVQRKHLFTTSFVAIALCITLGLLCKDKYVARYLSPATSEQYVAGFADNNPRREECHSIPSEKIAEGHLCHIGPDNYASNPSFLSWGDSHVDALMPLLEKLAQEGGVTGWHASSSSCPPLLDVVSQHIDVKMKQQCMSFNREMLNIATKKRFSHVILHGVWLTYALGWQGFEARSATGNPMLENAERKARTAEESIALMRAGLEGIISELRKTGSTVWLILPTPILEFHGPRKLAMTKRIPLFNTRPECMLDDHYKKSSAIREMLLSLASDNVHIIDPLPYFCDGQNMTLAVDGKSLYSDANHLSATGARFLAPAFDELLKAFKQCATAEQAQDK